MFRERIFCVLRDVFRFHDSLIRCFGLIVFFDRFGSDAFFFNEFNRGQKEVVKESPFMTVEIVHEGDYLGIVNRH